MAEKCLGLHSRSGSTCHSALRAASFHFFSIVTHSHDIATITERIQGSMWSPNLSTQNQSPISCLCATLVSNNLFMCSWFEYLNFLPNEVDGMPMYWTKKELQPLCNTSLAEKLNGKWGLPGCHVEPPTQVSCAAAPEGVDNATDWLTILPTMH